MFFTMVGILYVFNVELDRKPKIDSFSVLVLLVVLLTVHYCPRNVYLKTAASKYDKMKDTFSQNRYNRERTHEESVCE